MRKIPRGRVGFPDPTPSRLCVGPGPVLADCNTVPQKQRGRRLLNRHVRAGLSVERKEGSGLWLLLQTVREGSRNGILFRVPGTPSGWSFSLFRSGIAGRTSSPILPGRLEGSDFKAARDVGREQGRAGREKRDGSGDFDDAEGRDPACSPGTAGTALFLIGGGLSAASPCSWP